MDPCYNNILSYVNRGCEVALQMCELKSVMDGILASGTIYDGGTGCKSFYLKEKVVNEETQGMDKNEDENENIEKVIANIEDLFYSIPFYSTK